MKCNIHYRERCRVCGSRNLREFIKFTKIPFTDELIDFRHFGQEFSADLGLFWCEECRIVQTQHDVDVNEYYRAYSYTVSSSTFAQKFMQRLAQETVRRFKLFSGDIVIEIGSGDGFQLGCFQTLGMRVFGFEPSKELSSHAQDIGISTSQTLFNCESIDQIPANMRPAQVVLLTYTFDHLPDPRSFLNLINRVLDPDRGLLIIEVHDLAKIVARREVCLFEHEHSIYLTALTMQRLLKSCNFRLLCTDLLPESERRGNSLLVVAAPKSNSYHLDTFTLSPQDSIFEQWKCFEQFSNEVRRGVDRFRDYLHRKQQTGIRVAGYGAGGRGVITLAMAGISSSEMIYLCDQNIAFHGLFTPVTHIPIVNPDHVYLEPVSELVVFSYSYFDEIKQHFQRFIENGGRLTSILELI